MLVPTAGAVDTGSPRARGTGQHEGSDIRCPCPRPGHRLPPRPPQVRIVHMMPQRKSPRFGCFFGVTAFESCFQLAGEARNQDAGRKGGGGGCRLPLITHTRVFIHPRHAETQPSSRS
jgi:hypothetical protein